MTLTIDDLFQAPSADDVMATMLSTATTLGLDVSAWQPGSVARTLLRTAAETIASQGAIIATMNKGGFLAYAATVTPEGGSGWLDILAASVYQVTRIPATNATTTVTVTAVSASGGTFAAGTFHFTTAAGNVYTNTASFTIPSTGTVSVTVQADVAGADQSAGAGAINALLTPLVGVTCTNATPAVGTDAETNANLVLRCIERLAALSLLGPAGAYDFFARTINDPNAVQVVSGALTQPVQPATRTRVATNPTTGTVTTYVANASGPYATPPNYVQQVAKAIVSSTNASPIVVTVTSHGYTTGDTIYIVGHLVNTAANGSWAVTVLSGSTFELDGSTGNGVGGATGTAYRYSDLDLIDKSIQANAVPLAVTATTVSAAAAGVTVVGVVTVTGATSGLPDASITGPIYTALATLAAGFPIGGPGISGLLYLEQIRDTAFRANPSTVNVVLSSPVADVALASNEVVTFPTPAFTVVRV